MPVLANYDVCCGCSSCANKCTRGAISMQPDAGGFLTPIIDETICVECKLCEKACPALIEAKDNTELHNAYLLHHSDEEIRRQSTSGGAFTAISQVVLSKGGVVYGAIMSDDFIVKHSYVSNEIDLSKFRNSKYVQSEIGLTFREIKIRLKKGEYICFSGTPCQIAGLKSFLGEDYNNLLTVDVVCHAIPSPFVFQKYVELIKKKHPDANKLVFRDKKRGYSYSTMAWYDNNNKEVCRDSYELDEWYRLFLHDKCDRSSCYECIYQNRSRTSDITIWDCYNAHEICPDMDDNKGTTNIMVWTMKGEEIIKEATKYATVVPIDYKLTYGSTINHKRSRPEWDLNTFYDDAHNMNVEDFFSKYVPRSVKARMASFARLILWKIGLHDTVRKFIQNKRKSH